MNLLITLLISLPATHAAPATMNYTDEQISAIVMEANNADIEIAKMAKKKSKNPEVKIFAEEMIKDHASANHELQKVVEKANIQTKVNEKSKEIKLSKKDSNSNLKSLNWNDFDKAYAENEVMVHSQVLNTIDQDLIPNAKSPNLKEFLAKTRSTVVKHLEHAKHLQTQVNL